MSKFKSIREVCLETYQIKYMPDKKAKIEAYEMAIRQIHMIADIQLRRRLNGNSDPKGN